jgi:hypothetical protein
MRRILTLLVTLVIGVVVLAACEGSVSSLKVGHCYNAPSPIGGKITDIEIEPASCDEPHYDEVYAVFELTDSSWKGDDYVWEKARAGCRARFEAFVGIEPEISRYDVNIIYPLEEGWKERGNRQVRCSVVEVDIYGRDTKVTGSAKGSSR